MSVSAPTTSPPVQDSAVAMVSLRLRHKSSSERERARASLPLISIAPGQTNGGARHGGNAFLAAGKPGPLAGGGFPRDARQFQPGDLRDPRAHRLAQRSDLRPFANQRHVEMRDAPAARG